MTIKILLGLSIFFIWLITWLFINLYKECKEKEKEFIEYD